MKKSNTLLFRWVGSHIERRLKLLTDKKRCEYVEIIRDALNPLRGLYALAPEGDNFGKNFSVHLPCLCFTESAYRNNSEHCHEFGRMAFGFSKQFIANYGGGPVRYALGTSNDLLAKHLDVLLKDTEDCLTQNYIERIEFLAHFFKRLREEKPKGKFRKPRGIAKRRVSRELFKGDRLARLANYPNLIPMQFLEETEWRLVCPPEEKPKKTDRWHLFGWHCKGTAKRRSAYFKIEPGTDLQMVIVPDNRTLQMVMNDGKLPKKLFAEQRPPIQVLSLDGLSRLP